ncbi:MAG: thiolase family protein [Desulfobacteraceae bacterium]|nr:MAG: thiolase family protein [Desulfobacteraceae bacterium]
MKYTNAFIPYKGYYSTPFCRWQGSLANENAIELGAAVSRQLLEEKDIDVERLDYLIFGNTIGQHHQFYSSPWAAAMLGASKLPAIAISQACTTGATCINQAAMGVEQGLYSMPYVLTVDRCSNGPHTIWPNPKGPGGEVISENWNMDNFNGDPNTGQKMVETAENVGKLGGFTKEECDALALYRYEQYQTALKDDRAFQKRYMRPVEIRISKRKTIAVEEDEGVTPSTAEGLAKLKPLLPGGILSFGAQTHPADGNAGMLVTTKEIAGEVSEDANVSIQVISYGYARVEKAHMPAAPVPATRMALANAGLSIQDISVIKTHNPFVVNDLFLAKELDIDPKNINNFGSSMIFGHPQGPTATRLIIEGIEETVLKGGGYLLWTGCAAGDCGAALVLKIS